MLYQILFLFVIYSSSEGRIFINYLNHSYLSEHHGFLIGYFTFSGKGIAGLNYEINPFVNSTELHISLFPTAFDPHINLRRIKKYYSRKICTEFYKKAIYTARLTEYKGKLNLGRFSGGFAVSFVLTNRFSCFPFALKNRKEIPPEGSFGVKVILHNHDEDGKLRDHLSAVDQGMPTVVAVFLAVYCLMFIWTIYSIKNTRNQEVHLMMSIQRVVLMIVVLEIGIWALLLLCYNTLEHTGVMPLKPEIIAEVLAQIVKYMELYIIISWTLSSPRTQERKGDVIARFLGLCCGAQVMATFIHYWLLINQLSVQQYRNFLPDTTQKQILWQPTIVQGNTQTSCMTVWECESHIFTHGWASPTVFHATFPGIFVVFMNWFAGLIGFIFVLHLLKLGLAVTKQHPHQPPVPISTEHSQQLQVSPIRKAYFSVFSSASICWFMSYGATWLASSLVSDYFQYKFLVTLVAFCHWTALPAILKVTRISPDELTITEDESIVIRQSPEARFAMIQSDEEDDEMEDAVSKLIKNSG